jgi:hypothetical protein
VKKQKVVDPTESPQAVTARQRQITDLAKLDDEENKRIKQMRSASRGVRAFRALRTARASTGGGGAVGSSLAAPGDNQPDYGNIADLFTAGGG